MKKTTESQKRASKKYDAKNTKQVHLKFNINTDPDIMIWLTIRGADKDSGGIQGYIKKLIRDDISRQKPESEIYQALRNIGEFNEAHPEMIDLVD